MTVGQDEDVRAAFLFVGDLNCHHEEPLGSTTTNRHCVAAFDFATVFVCDVCLRTLDLLMTDVSNLGLL